MRLDSQDGRVAIVTGASSGIGRATALALARMGVRVVAAARNTAQLEHLASEVRSSGGEILVITVDVKDRAQIARLVREALAWHGRIDLLVCNAGVYLRGMVRDITPHVVEESMATNFFGAVELIHGVLPQMLERREGHIVAVTSVDGRKGLPLDAPYVAAKFALTGYMEVLRQELRGTGVDASTVLPARVDTPMIAHLRVPLVSAKIPSSRVAHAIVRAVQGRRAEVTVPFWGPKALLLANALSARLGDALVRIFRLEGEEETAYITPSKTEHQGRNGT